MTDVTLTSIVLHLKLPDGMLTSVLDDTQTPGGGSVKRIHSASGLTWCDLPDPGETGEGLVCVAGRLQSVTVTGVLHDQYRPETTLIVEGRQLIFFLTTSSQPRKECHRRDRELTLTSNEDRDDGYGFLTWDTDEVIQHEVEAIDPAIADLPWPVLRDALADRERHDLVQAGDFHYQFNPEANYATV